MKHLIKHTALALATVLAAPAFADAADVLPTSGDDIVEYRSFNDWAIMQNNTRGHCFAARSDDVGNVIQMGVSKAGDFGYLGLFNNAGAFEGDSEKVAILINGNLYAGDAEGVGTGLSSGYKGGFILVNNAAFVGDLEAAQEFYVFPDTPFSASVDAEGARNAIYEARKCMDAM